MAAQAFLLESLHLPWTTGPRVDVDVEISERSGSHDTGAFVEGHVRVRRWDSAEEARFRAKANLGVAHRVTLTDTLGQPHEFQEDVLTREQAIQVFQGLVDRINSRWSRLAGLEAAMIGDRP